MQHFSLQRIPFFFGAILTFCMEISPAKTYAQSSYFPPVIGKTWTTTSPSDLGWCNEKIDSLYTYLENHNSKAFILLKDGKIVLEKYFGSFTQDSFWYWASAGKTLTGFCTGIAQQEGLLNIHDRSSKYLGTGWTSLSQQQEDSITIFHQLTMTTGLDDGVNDPDCTDPGCLTYKAPAGTRWAYHNAPYTLMDKVIETATGTTLNQFVYQKITKNTGITGLFYKSGYLNVFGSTPRSFARFGLLLLNKGNWNGTQILSDTQFFKEQINSSQSLNPSYGYLTWLNGKSSYMLPSVQFQFPGSLCSYAPKDMFAALGKNGQIINVIPSLNMVWIRMGNAPDASPAGAISVSLNNDIWKYINQFACNVAVQPNKLLGTDWLLSPNPVKIGDAIEFHPQFLQNIEQTVFVAVAVTTGKSVKCISSPAGIETQGLNPGVYIFQAIQNHTIIAQRKIAIIL